MNLVCVPHRVQAGGLFGTCLHLLALSVSGKSRHVPGGRLAGVFAGITDNAGGVYPVATRHPNKGSGWIAGRAFGFRPAPPPPAPPRAILWRLLHFARFVLWSARAAGGPGSPLRLTRRSERKSRFVAAVISGPFRGFI